MTAIKKFLQAYFFHSKKYRIAVLCILIICSFFYAWPYVFVNHQAVSLIKPDETLLAAIDSLQQTNTLQNEEDDDDFQTAYYPTNPATNFIKGELFSFDPNTLSAEGWQRLGLKDKTVKTIMNYRNKGGKFYKAEDVRKIWGLPNGFYERVKDYITITTIQKLYTNDVKETTVYEKKERKITLVSINEADTSAFVALPGIGSKLAFRIVNFREKLGGFYSVDQIGETYGLPDSTFQKIKPYLQVDRQPKQLNVNTATKEDLKAHPYIKWNLANAIVEYRNQHGPFKSIEDLKNIVLIDEATYNKISHYLAL